MLRSFFSNHSFQAFFSPLLCHLSLVILSIVAVNLLSTPLLEALFSGELLRRSQQRGSSCILSVRIPHDVWQTFKVRHVGDNSYHPAFSFLETHEVLNDEAHRNLFGQQSAHAAHAFQMLFAWKRFGKSSRVIGHGAGDGSDPQCALRSIKKY